MENTDTAAAIAAFIAAKGVTRCPTACVTRTTGSLPDTDRAALAQRAAEMEAARHARHAVAV